MKAVIEIDLPNKTNELDSATLGVISRVLMSASNSFDIAYDEQEIDHDYVCEVDVHELPWRWRVTSGFNHDTRDCIQCQQRIEPNAGICFACHAAKTS